MKKWLIGLILALVGFAFTPFVSHAAIIEEELEDFLLENNLTEEELVEHLSFYYDEELASFASINELSDYIGERLTEENLLPVLESHGFVSVEEATNYLIEYGEILEGEDIISTYLFTSALDETLYFYEEVEFDAEEIGLDEFDLTSEEMTALFEHLMTLEIDDKEFEEKLLALDARLMALGDFESAEDLTTAQIEELYNVMNELLALFKLQAKFYLLDADGNTRLLSSQELISLESTNGQDLLIEIYDLNGNFLADMIFTSDMFDSEWFEETTESIASPETVKAVTEPLKTSVKGAKLPKTAGFYTEKLIVGIALLLMGLLLFRKWRAMTSK
ncbi:processed acidic surface protein [Bacillus pakistanensis]|uniref:Processed acidic surface protein n=1 Tax=Rossellomorea pakistanensis TaxID=992288 RepID=A0ABS2NGQ6_9BACI|nr:processed acidic surface protein [Bacillus pakistanensis]MBM7587015.1 processed acidic surface protein [Bacillus pakistanensis]